MSLRLSWSLPPRWSSCAEAITVTIGDTITGDTTLEATTATRIGTGATIIPGTAGNGAGCSVTRGGIVSGSSAVCPSTRGGKRGHSHCWWCAHRIQLDTSQSGEGGTSLGDTLLLFKAPKAGILSCEVHVCTPLNIRLTIGVSMCGRFTVATNTAALEERFHARLATELAVPTYNAAPSQAQLAILNDHLDTIVRAA